MSPRIALVYVLPALIAVTALAAVQGQTAQGEDAVKLSKPVHLAIGPATLADLCTAMSAQTGLAIEPADYLRERRFTAQLDGEPARAAPDAICELNDWTWTKASPGHYAVSRRKPHVVAEPASMAYAIRSALPKDWRVFLGIESVPGMTGVPGERRDPVRIAIACVNRAQQQLAASLQGTLSGPRDIPFTRLARSQREDLVAALAMRLFRMGEEAFWSGTPGVRGPQDMRLDQVRLEMPQGAGQGAGEMLMVNAVDEQGNSIGFGQNVVRPVFREPVP